MNIELEYGPVEYISYEPVSRVIAVSDRQRRSQRRLLFKHNKEETEESSKDNQDSVDNYTEYYENETFEPRKLFMKSRSFTQMGGNHSIFTHLDQVFWACYYHHSATFAI